MLSREDNELMCRVGPGTAIFVPAGVEHHFHSITAELQVLVIFAPAETPIST
jgi:mannose-6-phosphate isomerase-like protein (cupin superfamily)